MGQVGSGPENWVEFWNSRAQTRIVRELAAGNELCVVGCHSHSVDVVSSSGEATHFCCRCDAEKDDGNGDGN